VQGIQFTSRLLKFYQYFGKPKLIHRKNIQQRRVTRKGGSAIISSVHPDKTMALSTTRTPSEKHREPAAAQQACGTNNGPSVLEPKASERNHSPDH